MIPRESYATKKGDDDPCVDALVGPGALLTVDHANRTAFSSGARRPVAEFHCVGRSRRESTGTSGEASFSRLPVRPGSRLWVLRDGFNRALDLIQEYVALALDAKWLLTDDAAARLFAEALGLEAHGFLGVVLWAAATGQLGRAETETTLDNLAKSSVWVSARVLNEAKAAVAEIFTRQ